MYLVYTTAVKYTVNINYGSIHRLGKIWRRWNDQVNVCSKKGQHRIIGLHFIYIALYYKVCIRLLFLEKILKYLTESASILARSYFDINACVCMFYI